MRVLTVPFSNTENATAWAFGLEAWFPTVSDDALGTDSVVLGPQVFFTKFNPFGMRHAGIFPGYQHAFSVGIVRLN